MHSEVLVFAVMENVIFNCTMMMMMHKRDKKLNLKISTMNCITHLVL